MMDEITDIRKQRGFALVRVNDERELKVPLALLRERPLEIGQPLALEEYVEWLAHRQYPHALERAVAYLAVRDRSTREVRVKLAQAGFQEQTVERVLERLAEQGLLDDERFANALVQSRETQYGRRRIAAELQRKGVSGDAAHRAMSALDEQQQLREARHLAQKLLRRYAGEPARDARRKAVQALMRRGYGFDIAQKALGQDTMEDDFLE